MNLVRHFEYFDELQFSPKSVQQRPVPKLRFSEFLMYIAKYLGLFLRYA